MPLAAIIPALKAIGTYAIPAISGGITARKNRKQQDKQNKEDRDFTREMYGRQRADSIEDWYRMNEYNSPQQQMQRLREAGLNPNLVYGKGADNTATMIRSSNVPTNNQPAPQYKDAIGPAIEQGINAMSVYQNVKQSQAQTDNIVQMQKNLETQRLLTEKEIAKKDLEMSNLAITTARTQFDYSMAQELKDVTIQSAVLKNKLDEATINITNNRDLREKDLNTAQIQEIVQRTLSIKKDIAIKQFSIETQPLQKEKLQREIAQINVAIANAQKDGIFKDWENELAAKGITKNDPVALRMLEDVIQTLTKDTFNIDDKNRDLYIDKLNKFQKEYQKRMEEKFKKSKLEFRE